MITWLTLSQLWWLLCACRMSSTHKFENVAQEVSAAVLVITTAVPAIYAVGWLLLPRWGVGAIHFGG